MFIGRSSSGTFFNSSSKHAEMDVINKLSKYKNLSNSIDMFCFRVARNGNIGNSRPCSLCLKYMQKSKKNIKDIFYTDGNGNIIKESFKEMKSQHVSYGMRNKKN